MSAGHHESTPMTSDITSPQAFLAACADFLASDQIVSACAAQKKYGPNTLNLEVMLAGALLPHSEEEVEHIVALANQHHTRLYPISTGHNWGYGGATPHADHSIVIDLHRMRRIIGVDPELGVAVIEPGVTTGQLYDYLTAHNLDYLVPLTGAGPHNSIIGNALDRGFGIIPTSDHFQAILSLTAVLGDGRVYRSAIANNAASDIGHLYKWGVGPYLDGLLSQGNVGIVTQASIALVKRAPESVIFSMDCCGPYPDEAIDFISNVTRDYGANLSPISLMNKKRFLSSNPYESSTHAPDWKLFGVIHGDKRTTQAVKHGVKRYVTTNLTNQRFHRLSTILPIFALLDKMPHAIRARPSAKKITYIRTVCEFMRGKPTEHFLNYVVYDGLGKTPLNPDHDQKGLVWYAPLIPMRSSNVREFLTMAEKILTAYQFDFSITLINFSWRCFDGTLLLQYDRTNPADCARAMQCYEALFTEGMKLGFVPYRVGLQGMKLLVDETTPFWNIARDIKHALDPNGIISSGRYSLS